MAKYLPSQLAPAIVGIMIIPIVTRIFLPDVYGKYVLVTTTLAILTTLTSWLPTSVYRFYFDYKKRGRLNEFYSTTFRSFLTSTVLVAVIYLLILSILRNKLDSYLWLLLLIGVLSFILGDTIRLLTELLRLERKVGLFSLFNVVNNLASFGIGLYLVIFLRWDIQGLLWGGIFCSTLILPFVIKTVKNISFGNNKLFSKDLSLMMIKYGFPVVIGNFASWILAISDRYIVGLFKGSYEVGLYSVSYGISSQTIGLLTSLFTLAVGPIGMKVWEYEGRLASQEFITKTTRYLLLILIPSCFGLSILGKEILIIFASPKYLESYKIIPYVVFGAFFFNIRGRFMAGLLYHNKTNLVMVGTLISGLLNLVLNFIYIPKYGYFAAAVTTFISYIVLFMFTVFFSRKFFVWKFPFKTLFNTCIAAILMGFLIFYFNKIINIYAVVKITILISIGTLIYISSLLLLKELTNSELKTVKNIAIKIFPILKTFFKSANY